MRTDSVRSAAGPVPAPRAAMRNRTAAGRAARTATATRPQRATAPRMRSGSRSGQAPQGFAIVVAGARDHLGRQARPGSALVPVQGFQIVAHILLVERRRTGADAPGVGTSPPS